MRTKALVNVRTIKEGWTVQATVLDTREAYGRTDLRVRPELGGADLWVAADRCEPRARTLPLYEALARALGWRRAALEGRALVRGPGDGRTWLQVAGEHIRDLEGHLPPLPGGGNVTVDLERSSGDRIEIAAPYHHMDDVGHWDGWSEYVVVVRPSLAYGCDVRMRGRDRDGAKEYLAETFYAALCGEVEADP